MQYAKKSHHRRCSNDALDNTGIYAFNKESGRDHLYSYRTPDTLAYPPTSITIGRQIASCENAYASSNSGHWQWTEVYRQLG